MVQGIGIDVIEIGRVRQTMERWGNRFLQKIFTENELHYCLARKNPYQHLAARFAAKEAVSKALATGWTGIFRWQDVEIINDAAGKPEVRFLGYLGDNLHDRRIHLSLSHAETIVVAVAVIE
ncbi:MAG: holo-ACP synthase [Bacteroidota bacterium]